MHDRETGSCKTCGGTGSVSERCTACHGTGRRDVTCPSCRGRGDEPPRIWGGLRSKGRGAASAERGLTRDAHDSPRGRTSKAKGDSDMSKVTITDSKGRKVEVECDKEPVEKCREQAEKMYEKVKGNDP